jgi:hypothetical protein
MLPCVGYWLQAKVQFRVEAVFMCLCILCAGVVAHKKSVSHGVVNTLCLALNGSLDS